MMNAISSLYANGETLWIGYGDRTFQYNAMGVGHGGGLGNMDLATRRFSFFTLSLTNGVEIHRHPAGNWVPERSKEPTRRPVLAIASGETDDIWFVAEEARTLLRRFQPLRNVWSEPDDAMWNCTTLVQDGGQLLVGIYSGQSTKPGPLGVNILDMKDGKSRGVKEVSEIPAGVVTAMSIDGGDLWVGGRGYIAVMDLDKEVIRKYAFIKAQAVDALQIAGGHLWAQYGGYMHQVQLTTR